ncbi:MAG TPA: G8 domain-containing protein [Candidatus Binataceae bacterium]|nr:G8 domain-containing protein [Candidatus Binataceae bacterium]
MNFGEGVYTSLRAGLLKFLPGAALGLLMIALVSAGGLARAQEGPCVVNGTEIPSRALPAGTGGDLTVTKGECTADKGPYKYRDVNIYDGGKLTFVETRDAELVFSARSILVENKGSLTAGSVGKPFGSLNGKLTIHLWGKLSDPGITCKADDVDRCGVPSEIWTSNSPSTFNPTSCKVWPPNAMTEPLPGGVKDCFYAYETLDELDKTNNRKAYFGHKVLAVSFGGTLNLFGKKGATFDTKIDPKKSYKSWVRLKGSLKPGAATDTLTVDGVVDWAKDDHIVITTTDFLPEHSEELVITDDPAVSNGATTIKFANADAKVKGLKWPHNGLTYPLSLPARLGINEKSAETRAGVALLTRSIRIVSDGDTLGSTFTEEAGNFYGGDTIARQGFASFQVQGVEFYQLGKGGMIMHYPVHFHLARQTPQPINPKTNPPITFLKDSSIHDSMTRWVTIHGTQGVTLARNVGYMSIGHGFYLEDGTETDNKLYSNIGILARAAIDYPNNPRKVPGILTARPMDPPDPNPATAIGFDGFPFFSDSNHPSVFWIMNGWNDFEYNLAAGAGTCGACYWLVPGYISGPSQFEHWFGYAGEQKGFDRAGITPLQAFIGNACTSAMNAFTINSTTATCNGVNVRKAASTDAELTMLPSDGAKKSYIFPLPANDTYWPHVNGGGRLATRCPDADAGKTNPECTSFKRCDESSHENCDVTVLDRFTTSFNWAEKNLAAVWMRPQWSLVINSVISDILGAGLNFVTSGGYSKSDVITGFWALARKTVFIGSTQSGNPLASDAGPFNPFSGADGVKGLKCGPNPFDINGGYNPLYCLSKGEGISIQISNFSVFQRFFSVYDGPTYQDSNAYLNIHPTFLTANGLVNGNKLCRPDVNNGNPCVNTGFMNGGLNGVRAYRLGTTLACYLPNAAIGWKQPNGFYYAPAFHSENLFFDGVDIRHFVTEPLFGLDGDNIPCSSADPNACYGHQDKCKANLCTCMTNADCSRAPVSNVCDMSTKLCKYGSAFITDLPASKQENCFWNEALFNGFTDIDRETVLNDDDGSLTGLTSQVNKPAKTETISVNKENFFNAPSETVECASDVAANATGDAKKDPSTAKTSPYEWVTTAVYPECALSVPDSKADVRYCSDRHWGSNCTTSDPTQVSTCIGIPIYRQFLTEQEMADKAPPLEQAKRMMGQNTFQRSGLTVNHGHYYIDDTISLSASGVASKSPNALVGGEKYELYFLYAKPRTKQTYTLWLGKNLTKEQFDPNKSVLYGHTDISQGGKFPFVPKKDGSTNVWPTGWVRDYTPSTGYLTISFDMNAPEVKDDFNLNKPIDKPLGQELCQPASMCKWGTNKNTAKTDCVCSITDTSNPLYSTCNETITDKSSPDFGRYAVCRWSVKDLDCPAAGCEAIEITMPGDFKPDDAADHHRPAPVAFDGAFDWKVSFNNEDTAISGAQCHYDPAELP